MILLPALPVLVRRLRTVAAATLEARSRDSVRKDFHSGSAYLSLMYLLCIHVLSRSSSAFLPGGLTLAGRVPR